MKSDLKAVGIQERDWYEEAQHRKQWYVTCNEGLSKHQHVQQRRKKWAPHDVKCSVCGWCFRRESDKARHRCTAVRKKPGQEQEGAVGVGEDYMCTDVWVENVLWSARSVVELSVGPVTGRGISAWLKSKASKNTERCFAM